MCRPVALSAWTAELEGVFGHLSKPQVKVLAEYSLGMVLAGRCGLSCAALALAQWLSQKFDAVRERLRDWYCRASDKSGRKRRDLDVGSCFAPLLAWVLRDWVGDDLAIALDATTLGERFVVLAISVMYRSCAIPVAWVVLPAVAKGAWKPHWLGLLQRFKSVVPPRLRVIVLTDRGLYAKWLFKAIVALGWHPFLRINTNNADFKPEGGRDYLPLGSLLDGVGSSYGGRGTMFRSTEARLDCTLLAAWGEGYEEGWFVLSDLPQEQTSVAWYGLRGWIERGFKHAKSGGWNWQETRMTDPDRASRQWLAMAVAAVLLMRQGAAAEIRTPPSHPLPPPSQARNTPADQPGSTHTQTPEPLGPAGNPPASSPHKSKPRRILSVFRRGLLIVQSALLANLPLHHGRFVPEPWPQSMPGNSCPAPSARSP
ncbi:MAG: transposase [Terriglobia bacterium]